jgi:hypothetical protein
MAKQSEVAILTLVSNAAGYGPGHSAIVVQGTVYSFEQIKGPFGDSWLVMPVKEYLAINEHRPVLVQELSEKVSAPDVVRYIENSANADDDYATSGVCSSQVGSAIEEGWGQPFNPSGPDTPASIFEMAKNKGIVSRTYSYWPGKDALPDSVKKRLTERLKKEYPGLAADPADGIRDRKAKRPPKAPAPSAPATKEEVVPVVPKTTLSGVALAKYQTYELWPLIWDLNQSAIGDNPNRLKNVKELRVRPLASYSSSEIAAAKARAPSWKNYPL